jgi:parallel beta-helix repeat protein
MNLQVIFIIGVMSFVAMLGIGCAILIATPPDLGGYVLAVNGDEILIDLTEQNGITKGMTFLILRRTAANQPMQVLGEMVVTQLEPKLSRGRLLVENETIRPGDLIRTKPGEFTETKPWQVPPIRRRDGAQVSGPLAFDEVWSGEIHVTGDVTVPVGVTLRIEPGTQVIFTADSDDRESGENPKLCELIIEGRLEARGTPEKLIQFISDKPHSGQDAPEWQGDWQGIRFLRVNDKQNSVIKFTRISYAFQGVKLMHSSSVTLMDSDLFYNYSQGIYCESSSPQIHNNTLRRSIEGIVCEGESKPSIVGNRISRTHRGIRVNSISGAPLEIQNNTVSDNYDGFFIGTVGNQAILIGNQITRNQIGIRCGGPVVVTLKGNRVTKNTDYGIFLENSGPPTLILLNGGNTIMSNRLYDLYNLSQAEIQATGNYWGTADPLTIDRRIYDDEEDVDDRNHDGIISGKVIFEPYLDVAP